MSNESGSQRYDFFGGSSFEAKPGALTQALHNAAEPRAAQSVAVGAGAAITSIIRKPETPGQKR